MDTNQNEIIVAGITSHLASGLREIATRYPNTYEKLLEAARRLSSGNSSHAYQEVGLHCRDAMVLFADTIYSRDFLPRGQGAAGDQAKIAITLQHFGQMAGSERERDLAKKAQAYAMGTHHDSSSDRTAARRTLAATTFALVELARIMQTATANNELMARWGRYKCGGCGGTRIQEQQDDDFEGPGPKMLVCDNCGWFEIE